MELRKLKKTRIRDRTLVRPVAEDSRAMYRRVGAGIMHVVHMARRGIRSVLDVDYASMVVRERKDDGRRHFAETMVGGIAITFGALGGVLVVLWIGSFL